jgi:hypothetical protein
MDLTGQLSNLSAALARLLALPLPRFSGQTCRTSARPASTFRRRKYEVIRDAIVAELLETDTGLRLKEMRSRVESRLGEPVAPARFREYVNAQSKGATPLLERLGYGRYRLRSRIEPSQALYL